AGQGGSWTMAAGAGRLEGGAVSQAKGPANGAVGTVVITSAGLVSLGAGSHIDVKPGDGTLDMTVGSLSLAAMALIQVTDAVGGGGALLVTSAGALPPSP